ncbi:hypothetical protein GS444_06135 [Rhodococcus hoagii]|nr:hypothetical protein [Prescottella equi]
MHRYRRTRSRAGPTARRGRPRLHLPAEHSPLPVAGRLRLGRRDPHRADLRRGHWHPHDPPESIPDEAQRIFGELADANHLRGLSRDEFTTALAEHWGDLTSLHPFVDGNSRTQRLYVDQLARRAGWEIDWRAASAPAIQRLETSLSSTAARSSATSSSPSSSPPAQSPPRLSQPRRATTRWTPPTTGAQ